MPSKLTFIILISLAIIGCNKEEQIMSVEPKIMEIPNGFPNITFPSDNDYSEARWTLGKKLFYDKALSRNFTISCGSCHKPELAFSDNVSLSKGEQGLLGKSNAPSLTNIAYHPYFTRTGGVPTLEMQVLVPIQEHDEFDFNIVDIAVRLSKDSTYNREAMVAYGRKIDPYVITRALANFERSFISGNAAFDKFSFQGKEDALTDTQLKGKSLFYSERTNCSFCHGGFNFTDYGFKNNGLYEVYADTGRMRFTQLEADRALFKTPSLRNVEFTAPYMHDGSIKTLDDVIEHYNSGGKNSVNKSDKIKPLYLTEGEKSALVAFLKSLSDVQFTNNKNFKP